MTPGFTDPVLDSQATFRAVLDAMARPGTIHTVTTPPEPPEPLARATAAVLLTLVDAETPLHLPPEAAPALPWITFHTGAPQAPADKAAFALLLAPGHRPLATGHCPGTDDAPETSTTVTLQVQALGQGPLYRLQGPGLQHPTTLAIAGLPESFLADWAHNHSLFPRGIDLILTAGDHLTALPRTLQIEAA